MPLLLAFCRSSPGRTGRTVPDVRCQLLPHPRRSTSVPSRSENDCFYVIQYHLLIFSPFQTSQFFWVAACILQQKAPDPDKTFPWTAALSHDPTSPELQTSALPDGISLMDGPIGSEAASARLSRRTRRRCSPSSLLTQTDKLCRSVFTPSSKITPFFICSAASLGKFPRYKPDRPYPHVFRGKQFMGQCSKSLMISKQALCIRSQPSNGKRSP